jgi:hypothetical protein
MSTVMRIDHDSDLTNRYAQAFRNKHVFAHFATQYAQHSLVTATDSDATEQHVASVLSQNSVDYISGAGHGTYYTFIGSDDNPIWDADQNSGALTHLKGKIVHLLACETGAVLGRSIASEGARAFWGYTVSFAFAHFDKPPSLEDDALAEVFLKMDMIIDRGILAGRNGTDIYDSIERYVAQVVLSLTALHRGLLLSNFVHLACPVIDWGDETAVVA